MTTIGPEDHAMSRPGQATADDYARVPLERDDQVAELVAELLGGHAGRVAAAVLDVHAEPQHRASMSPASMRLTRDCDTFIAAATSSCRKSLACRTCRSR